MLDRPKTSKYQGPEAEAVVDTQGRVQKRWSLLMVKQWFLISNGRCLC